MIASCDAATELANALVGGVSVSIGGVTRVRISNGSIWRIVRDQTASTKQTTSSDEKDDACIHWTYGMHVADTLMYELFLLRVQFVPELSSQT